MLRIVFIGTAELAVASLNALHHQPGFEIPLVVTQPDRPQGRKLQLKPTPVKAAALEAGLTVFQPEKIRTEESLQVIRNAKPDLLVVAAYGQILPKTLLDLPRWGCLNVHTSLLPKYRGAAPIQWSILNGDEQTGVTLMQMDPGLDTGPILTQQATPISDTDDALSLHDRLARIGSELLIRTIPAWVAGELKPQPQSEEGTCYARKIEKQDGLLDWNLPAKTLWNRVRGLVPWPGAFCLRPDGTESRVLKVWEAAPDVSASPGESGEVLQADASGIRVRCGEGSLRLLALQREGGKRLSAREFLAGQPIQVGERWGSVNQHREQAPEQQK
jgi:methionyl-tRNA formyltransferase